MLKNSITWLTKRSDLKTKSFNIAIAHLDQSYYFLNVVVMGFGIKASLTAKKLKFFGDSAYTFQVGEVDGGAANRSLPAGQGRDQIYDFAVDLA